MKRRSFIAATTCALAAATSTQRVIAADDETAVKKLVESVYSVYYQDKDKVRYRQLLTADYLLLEHGELMSLEQDVALMPVPGGPYRRTDSFEFKLVNIMGNTAYAVYFLTSDITDEKGTRHRQWLESAVLRRSGPRSAWRMALLHSTRIEKPGT